MRSNKLFFSLLLLSVTLFAVKGQEIPSWAQGASGASLLEIVNKNCQPIKHVEAWEIAEVVGRLETDDSQTILNRFSSVVFPADKYLNLSQLQVVPEAWMVMAGNSQKEFIATDLHNIFPCESSIVNLLANGYGPGVPENVTFDNGVIRIGESGAYNIGRWDFPSAYKGELARSFFYMIAVYPMTQWSALASNYLSAYDPLVIKGETLEYLLKCHSDNPPTERELARNEAIKALQGNYNPFVAYPSLVELVWNPQANDGNGDDDNGDNEEDNPGDDPQETVGELKAVYDNSDEWIWLNHKYVPADAVWSVDGVETGENRVAVSALSKGKHLLEYRHVSGKGKIIVEVR